MIPLSPSVAILRNTLLTFMPIFAVAGPMTIRVVSLAAPPPGLTIAGTKPVENTRQFQHVAPIDTSLGFVEKIEKFRHVVMAP